MFGFVFLPFLFLDDREQLNSFLLFLMLASISWPLSVAIINTLDKLKPSFSLSQLFKDVVNSYLKTASNTLLHLMDIFLRLVNLIAVMLVTIGITSVFSAYAFYASTLPNGIPGVIANYLVEHSKHSGISDFQILYTSFGVAVVALVLTSLALIMVMIYSEKMILQQDEDKADETH